MSDPTEASGLTPDELARMEANAAAAQVTAEWRDLMVGHIRRLAVAYRELSAHAAVQVSTRTDRIADLEGALRAAIEQRDSARAHRDRLNAAWLRADAALSDQGRAVVDSTGDLASAIESDTTALRSEVVRLRAERDEALNQRWSDDDAPGGYVCATCGVTVESEPCPKHSPDGLRARLKRARRGRREARQQVRALEETLVCAICGVTVESEPCPEHSPDGLRARLEHARRGRREARQQVRALTFERDRLRLAWESARRGRREARKRTGPTRPSRAEMTPAKRTALETIGRPLRTGEAAPGGDAS